jgi:hypothetical protein
VAVHVNCDLWDLHFLGREGGNGRVAFTVLGKRTAMSLAICCKGTHASRKPYNMGTLMYSGGCSLTQLHETSANNLHKGWRCGSSV